VKLGVMYNTGAYRLDPDAMIAVARHAEACGFESFYLPEHVALYPGASLGAVTFPADLPVADPLECLSFVAAATERILLGTAVLLLPYHQPVVLAKRLATIDLLSKGRMRLLTVGVGALPGEAAAVGVDYATRGRRADEAIDALRLLWGGDENGVSFDGEFYSFADACSFPKPLGPLPIHVGGSSPAAARRAGLRGDGYFPGGRLTPAERASQIELMRATAREAGRNPGPLEVTRFGSIDMTADDVAQEAVRGVNRLVIGPATADLPEQLDQLTALAERLALR
jgi:probable F420-dependent oxidoreductase